MRRIIKQLLAAALYYSGLLTLLDYCALKFAVRSHSVLLMYHRVLDDPFAEHEYAQTGTAVSTASFRAQIAFLAKRFGVMTAGDYVAARANGQPLPRKCAVITFDDGWEDNYRNAFPILKNYNVPATIFICTDFVGTKEKLWFHEMLHSIRWQQLKAAQLAQVLAKYQTGNSNQPDTKIHLTDDCSKDVLIDNFFQLAKALDAEQVKKLASDLRGISGKTDAQWMERRFSLTWQEIAGMDQSRIEIGSHGVSHRLLTSVSQDDVVRELSESKQQIEMRLGKKVRTFAYPNGSYDENIKRMTAEAGYDGAFSVSEVAITSDLFAIPRTGVHEGANIGFNGRFSRATWALALSPARKVWFSGRRNLSSQGY